MTVMWLSEIADFYSAERSLGTSGTVHLTVESLGECGWDWHVWDAAGLGQQHDGLSDTVEEAKGKAECALEALTQQLGLAA